MYGHPAATAVRRRLSIASRRLGTSDPSAAIGGLLDRTFELPLGDPRYGNNALVPGSMPLEHSFSEVAGQSLRLDLEPLGPGAAPISRRNEANREMRRLVQQSFGKRALDWFDERSEPWRGADLAGNASFGAFFGAGFDGRGLQEAKVYYELGPGQLEELPPNLRHATRTAMASLPGLQPLFVSVGCGRARGSQRVYFTHRGDLRLLELEPLMNRLGIGRQLPSLLTSIGLVLGGRFVLPEGAVVLGLRDTSKGMEMKLEILLSGVSDPPREMHGLIKMHLAQRPESHRAFQQWFQAMTPDEFANPGDISVVSARVTPAAGARLSVYFRPVGYDAAPSRSRGNGHRQADPYAALTP
ncbi:MAG: hypothetical protein AAF682_10300 [Planctomycetota bacterium]